MTKKERNKPAKSKVTAEIMNLDRYLNSIQRCADYLQDEAIEYECYKIVEALENLKKSAELELITHGYANRNVQADGNYYKN